MFFYFIIRLSLLNIEIFFFFLNSFDLSDCSFVQNYFFFIVKEDFIDLNSKCFVDFEDKIEVLFVVWFFEGLKFVLDNILILVLLLKLNIFSELVVCDIGMEVVLNRRNQFYVYIIKICIEEVVKNLYFFLIQILYFR